MSLLPCPFCGGEATLASSDHEQPGDRLSLVYCLECNAENVGHRHETLSEADESARAAWNRRAVPVPHSSTCSPKEEA